MDIKKRNSALDITRIAALFSVVGVHFFLNSGYYDTPMMGGRMLLMTVIRTGFMVCVPLFIMLTGYLMNKKTLSGRYYLGIVRTLAVYLLACIVCLVYKSVGAGAAVTVGDGILSVLDYSAAPYAWYIEMYIGLFLLIPFLNAMWKGLETKKARTVLIITLLALTSLPTVFNIYNFYVEGWILTPYLSTVYSKLLPDFWTFLYPVAYYFLGVYIKEYPIKPRVWLNLLVFFASVVLFGLFNYYRSFGGYFSWGKYTDWYGLPTVIMSVLAFVFFSSLDTSRLPVMLRKILARISDVCLGAYLVSYIFDSIVYAKLNSAVPDMIDRIWWFLPVTLTVFAMSLALSFALNLIYDGLSKSVMFYISKSGSRRNKVASSADSAAALHEESAEKEYSTVNKD